MPAQQFRFDKVEELARLINYFKRQEIRVTFGRADDVTVLDEQSVVIISKDEVKITIDLQHKKMDKTQLPKKGRPVDDCDIEKDEEEDDDEG